MSDNREAKSTDFNDIFSGSQKPSLRLDCSYLDDDEEGGINKVAIDYEDEGDDPFVYTVRKFSTISASFSSKNVVDEGQEQRNSLKVSTSHTLLFLGSSSTGKTSLCNQLKSSTMICLQEGQEVGKKQTELGVEVDGWQFRLHLVDLPSCSCHSLLQGDVVCCDLLSSCNPSVVVVVMAVDDRQSLEVAGAVLAMLRREGRLVNKVGMLVANKTDLVRSRVVKEEEGKILAGRYNVIYMETSTVINYNIDEMLLRTVKEVQEVQEVLNMEQSRKMKKMSVTERIKDLVVRKKSGDKSQDKEEILERRKMNK